MYSSDLKSRLAGLWIGLLWWLEIHISPILSLNWHKYSNNIQIIHVWYEQSKKRCKIIKTFKTLNILTARYGCFIAFSAVAVIYQIISRQKMILLKLKNLRVAASIHQLLALDFSIYFVV